MENDGKMSQIKEKVKTQGDSVKNGLSPYDLNAGENPRNVITQCNYMVKTTTNGCEE